jgi:hypothetical protein
VPVPIVQQSPTGTSQTEETDDPLYKIKGKADTFVKCAKATKQVWQMEMEMATLAPSWDIVDLQQQPIEPT